MALAAAAAEAKSNKGLTAFTLSMRPGVAIFHFHFPFPIHDSYFGHPFSVFLSVFVFTFIDMLFLYSRILLTPFFRCFFSVFIHSLIRSFINSPRKLEERGAALAAAEAKSNLGLTAFSLSMRPGGGGGGGGAMTAAEDGSGDVSVEQFSISAPKVGVRFV